MLAVSHDTEFEATSCAGATGHTPNHVVSLIKIRELRRFHAGRAAQTKKTKDFYVRHGLNHHFRAKALLRSYLHACFTIDNSQPPGSIKNVISLSPNSTKDVAPPSGCGCSLSVSAEDNAPPPGSAETLLYQQASLKMFRHSPKASDSDKNVGPPLGFVEDRALHPGSTHSTICGGPRSAFRLRSTT
ncbi:Uncharacterized protein DAT39_015420 [Clarias magur]|uniref:Uncharacterized protein n=1 Tax=Clarias magur TaxID=1594786 RepID=A0A8J4UI29_CLAMG|nr:Uncharacterized protein DAT39_015420 [Clarias magur]